MGFFYKKYRYFAAVGLQKKARAVPLCGTALFSIVLFALLKSD